MERQLAVKINESNEMPHRAAAETDHRHTVVVVVLPIRSRAA